MLSANYRNMIIDALENYDTENISIAIPTYYPEIKPRIEAISKRIVTYRNQKGLPSSDNYNRYNEYRTDALCLRADYKIVLDKLNTVSDLQLSLSRQRKRPTAKTFLGWYHRFCRLGNYFTYFLFIRLRYLFYPLVKTYSTSDHIICNILASNIKVQETNISAILSGYRTRHNRMSIYKKAGSQKA